MHNFTEILAPLVSKFILYLQKELADTLQSIRVSMQLKLYVGLRTRIAVITLIIVVFVGSNSGHHITSHHITSQGDPQELYNEVSNCKE